jgi:hypothetical protein
MQMSMKANARASVLVFLVVSFVCLRLGSEATAAATKAVTPPTMQGKSAKVTVAYYVVRKGWYVRRTADGDKPLEDRKLLKDFVAILKAKIGDDRVKSVNSDFDQPPSCDARSLCEEVSFSEQTISETDIEIVPSLSPNPPSGLSEPDLTKPCPLSGPKKDVWILNTRTDLLNRAAERMVAYDKALGGLSR